MRTSFFVYLSLLCPRNELKIVEVGTLEGVNTIEMAKVFPKSSIYTIDSYPEGNEQFMLKMLENIKPYPQIKFIHKDSIEAADDFKDLSLDYVYLDGDHSYEYIYKEICKWYPKVKWGGMLAGHDWWFKGVQEAVKNLSKENNLRLFYMGFTSKVLHSKEADLCDWWVWKNEVTL